MNIRYKCDRCGEDTPNGEGTYIKGDRLCCDCAEVEAFWETIDADEGVGS